MKNTSIIYIKGTVSREFCVQGLCVGCLYLKDADFVITFLYSILCIHTCNEYKYKTDFICSLDTENKLDSALSRTALSWTQLGNRAFQNSANMTQSCPVNQRANNKLPNSRKHLLNHVKIRSHRIELLYPCSFA